MLQLKVNHPLFLPSAQRPGRYEESHQEAGCGRMDMETGRQSLAPEPPEFQQHGNTAPGLRRLMHKCLLLSSQIPRLSALQNPGRKDWKRKENENNIHFPSNFEKTSDWEAWTLPSTSTSAAVCGYLWDKKEVLWPPVMMQQGRQESGHSTAMLQASLSTGWEDGEESKQWLFTVSSLVVCRISSPRGKLPVQFKTSLRATSL